MYRAQQGAAEPTLVFLPILLATSASSLAGLLAVAIMQRLKIWQPVVLGYLLAGSLPGIWIGSMLVHRAPERLIRSFLSLLLAWAGSKLVFL